MKNQQLELCPKNLFTDPATYNIGKTVLIIRNGRQWGYLECLGVNSFKKASLEPSLGQELPSQVPTVGSVFSQLMSRLSVLPPRLGSLSMGIGMYFYL